MALADEVLAEHGYGKEAALAGDHGNLIAELLMNKKGHLFQQAFNLWSQKVYQGTAENGVGFASYLESNGFKASDFKTSAQTLFNNVKNGNDTQSKVAKLEVTVKADDGFSTQVRAKTLYQEGLHDVTGTGKYYQIDNLVSDDGH